MTELITGLDLVQLQIAVAEGEPLPTSALEAKVTGHAIEARLYAENVAEGYLPATGSLLLFDVPELPGVRVDSGVRTGIEVSIYYDPMLAKFIAHAPTRSQAARLLARALAESRILGVVTNRDLLLGILREDEFNRGHIDTGYLTRHDPLELSAVSPEQIPVHALAVSLADQAARRAEARVLTAVPSGWRNVPNAPNNVAHGRGASGRRTTACVTTPAASVDGVELSDVIVHACTPDLVDLQVAGVRRTVAVARRGQTRLPTPSRQHDVLRAHPLPRAHRPRRARLPRRADAGHRHPGRNRPRADRGGRRHRRGARGHEDGTPSQGAPYRHRGRA